MSHPCGFSALSVVSGRISKVLELNVNTGHPLMFQCDDSYTLVGAPLSPHANMRKINSCAATCLHSQKSLLQQEDKHTLKTLCIIIEFLNQFHNTCRDKKSPTQLLLICSLSLVKCAGFWVVSGVTCVLEPRSISTYGTDKLGYVLMLYLWNISVMQTRAVSNL